MTNALLKPDLFAPPVRPNAGRDAEGDAYCASVPAEARRAEGITLTPHWLVDRMIDQAAAAGRFDTVVDPGAGSGRFSLAAARRFPQARVLAIERNPTLAALLRRSVRQEGLTSRVEVIEGDFRSFDLATSGRTLTIGNPPYVRHHDIEPAWKRWYGQGMSARGIAASQLAGLHAHFMLRIAQRLRPGDAWCLVTAAEWLDNGYGSALRSLLCAPGGMGLRSLWLAASDESVFPDALVSAVVVAGEAGAGPTAVGMGQLRAAGSTVTRAVDAEALLAAGRWSPLCQPGPLQVASGIEVGDLFRVTRGQVTGMNEAWVLPTDAPTAWQALSVPGVTRAREIIDGTVVAPDARLRLKRVIDLPREPDALEPALRDAAHALIERARRLGADRGYIARHRQPWFAVGMREPPAAFVSYMGRRPPVFQPNPQCVSFLNIAHGLYPRQPVEPANLLRVLAHLNATTGLYAGRVYGGGLAKFEPSDVSRLRLPASVWEPAA
jgi:hypothetical protein